MKEKPLLPIIITSHRTPLRFRETKRNNVALSYTYTTRHKTHTHTHTYTLFNSKKRNGILLGRVNAAKQFPTYVERHKYYVAVADAVRYCCMQSPLDCMCMHAPRGEYFMCRSHGMCHGVVDVPP